MFELIERLRQKPDHSKKQIAFLVSLFLVGIIFVIWLSVIFPNWREGQEREAKVEALEKSPGSAVSQTFSDGFSAIGEQFNKIKETLYSFSSEAEYYSATTTAEVEKSAEPEIKFLELN